MNTLREIYKLIYGIIIAYFGIGIYFTAKLTGSFWLCVLIFSLLPILDHYHRKYLELEACKKLARDILNQVNQEMNKIDQDFEKFVTVKVKVNKEIDKGDNIYLGDVIDEN